MNKKPLAAAMVLAAASLPSFATTTDFGAHDPVEFGFGSFLGAGTSFMDIFTFELAAPTTLTTTAVSVEAPTAGLDLTGSIVSLYAGAVGSGSFVSSFAFDNTAITTSITPLAAGDYYYQVSGAVGATAVAGTYTVVSQAAVVPELQSAALMIAGLGAIGFLVLRRKDLG